MELLHFPVLIVLILDDNANCGGSESKIFFDYTRKHQRERKFSIYLHFVGGSVFIVSEWSVVSNVNVEFESIN